MDDSTKKNSKRRQVNNEVIFRQANERVQQELDELDDAAQLGDLSPWLANDDTSMYFYCECSDENCRERIALAPSTYDDIHYSRKQFIVKVGHEDDSIEQVVLKKPDYTIVQKFQRPPEAAEGLKKTDVDNS